LKQQDADLAAVLSAADSAQGAAAVQKLLTTTSGALRLLQALDHGQLKNDLPAKVVELAAANANANVRDLFEQFLPEERRVRRLGTSINVAALLARSGDAKRGRQLFFNTSGILCHSCHQINGEGKDVGPDLSHIAKKLGRPQLLENLIDPSKTIEDKYTNYALQTVDGRAATGLLIERTAQFVAVKDAQSKVLRVPVSEVEVLEAQKKSLMPDFLLRDMTIEQAADLLAYLASLQ
jgi:putative heme-binding domain-containing protein